MRGPKLKTTADVSLFLARLIREVYAGKTEPKVAGTLIYGCNALRASLETSDLEVRLSVLEGRLAGGNGQTQPVSVVLKATDK